MGKNNDLDEKLFFEIIEFVRTKENIMTAVIQQVNIVVK